MLFFYLKALHIIFVVTWFAGLFYIVRLLVYHAEAENLILQERKVLQDQYKIMEKRLWFGITWPSMILVLLTGTVLTLKYYLPVPGWLILKIALVLLLVIYHLFTHKMVKDAKKDSLKLSSFKLRLWNEVPTLILISVVFLVVFKSMNGLTGGIAVMIILALIFFLVARIYKSIREK